MSRPKASIAVLAALILCAAIGMCWLSSKPKGMESEENKQYLENGWRDLPLEIWGRAVDFTIAPSAPFFSLSVERDDRRFEVTGYYSPTFADFEVDWRAEPLVRVVGNIVDTDSVRAWDVDVMMGNRLRNWYKFYPGERDFFMHPIAFLGANIGKRVWFSAEDCPCEIRIENGEIFEIHENVLGKKAFFWGVIGRPEMVNIGTPFYLELREMYVEQYVRIYP